MTTEQLLAPRYKVIADYPGSPYLLSEIKDNIGPNLAGWFSKYPHLFRKLEWWEERGAEILDKIKYVKSNCDKGQPFNVCKVKQFTGMGLAIDFEDGAEGHVSFWLPSTETEYLTYINSKP